MILREDLIGQGASSMISQQRIPSWNTAGRPTKAKPGTFGYNFQTNNLEYWNGSRWLNLHMAVLENEESSSGLGEAPTESEIASSDSEPKKG